MIPAQRLTAIIEREDDVFVALCPEFDIASQGASIEEARTNLIEALTLFFETASPSEVARRSRNEIFVTQVEVPVGWTSSSFGIGDPSDSRTKRIRRSPPARQPSGQALGDDHDNRSGSASQSHATRHPAEHRSAIGTPEVVV
jgi:predicted RNase H-like HicB family nuclease